MTKRITLADIWQPKCRDKQTTCPPYTGATLPAPGGCQWIGHYHLECRNEGSDYVYFDTRNGDEVRRINQKRWNGFDNGPRTQFFNNLMAHQVTRERFFIDRAERQVEDMANLYGSMMGSRTAGLVGHDEMTAQVATWKGIVRVFIDKDGDFEVYLADKDGANGFVALRGNANSMTVEDAAGDPVSVQALSSKLDPIVVKNRGKAYGQAAPSNTGPTKKTTRKKGTGTSAITKPPAQKKTKTKVAKPAKVDELAPGTRVRLVSSTNAKLAAKGIETGHEGVIEKVKADSPVGPAITVEFDWKGTHVLYPDEGDVLEVITSDAGAGTPTDPEEATASA